MTPYNILFGENDRPYVGVDDYDHFVSIRNAIFGDALTLKKSGATDHYWMFGDVVATWSGTTDDGLVYLPRQFDYTGQLYVDGDGQVLTKYQI